MQVLLVLSWLPTVLIAPGHLSYFFEFLFELPFADSVIVSAPHQRYEVFVYTYVLD